MASEVFFIPVEDIDDPAAVAERVGRLADAVGVGEIAGSGGMYMLKIHFGERGNLTFIRPPWVKPLVDRVKEAGSRIFLADTNTLYVGMRSNAVDHLTIANEHGWTFDALGAPVIIADGLLGENQTPVEVNLKHYRQVYLANDARCVDGFLVASNVTGHVLSGLGGAIKNVGMGLAGRGGKRSQHCDMRPQVITEKCVACGTCAQWCPTDAITVSERAEIDYEKCIGCGECYAVCRYGAIMFEWSESSVGLQEKMAEHCYGALQGKMGKSVFFNFLTQVTENCNCMGHAEEPEIPPVGVIAGRDLVAVDQASIDLVAEAAGEDLFKRMYPSWDATVQLEHAAELGLGSREYRLKRVH